MHRELDLIDVWFDSGAMPYAQIHYPFENKEAFDRGDVFPSDFIAEGVDQTRGWFYTLHAIATMVFDTVSYKAVISNGLVLDKDGNKMAKRLGNTVNPFDVLEQYGADPTRWYMIENSSPWDNLKFDVKGVGEVSRKLFGTLFNTYKFFATYANIDGFTGREAEVPYAERPEIDRWVLSVLNSLVKEVEADLDDYEPTRAARAISAFVDADLSNWFVRLNRKRFWAGKMDTDKLSAYQTLFSCLRTVAMLMAPFAPFYADRLYSDLMAPVTGEDYNSVHLAILPDADDKQIDPDLERRMRLAQDITSNVLALRRKVNIKVRQPLQTLLIPVTGPRMRADVEAIAPIVKAEVNVKEIKIVDNEQSGLVKRVKADFKKLGPRYGKVMKALGKGIASMSQQAIAQLESKGEYTFADIDGAPVVALADVEIIPEDVPGWLVANDGNITVALDVTLTPELKNEGMARELVKRIQNIRKESGFEITDRIDVVLQNVPEIAGAVEAFGDYIASQVLADSLSLADSPADDARDLEIEDLDAKVEVKRK
ncbi:MAG: DUF5915 domain-containing protein, partial [Porphyromonadaceae bacterium]|nr:DUF5915 domain-containing protein [Porphyromonadaceae bacterium]